MEGAPYNLLYNIRSGKMEVTQNNMTPRIAKALKHLIELDGGRLKEDIF